MSNHEGFGSIDLGELGGMAPRGKVGRPPGRIVRPTTTYQRRGRIVRPTKTFPRRGRIIRPTTTFPARGRIVQPTQTYGAWTRHRQRLKQLRPAQYR